MKTCALALHLVQAVNGPSEEISQAFAEDAGVGGVVMQHTNLPRAHNAILDRIRAPDGPIGFQYLVDFAAGEHGIDGCKMAAILTDLIRSGHVAHPRDG